MFIYNIYYNKGRKGVSARAKRRELVLCIVSVICLGHLVTAVSQLQEHFFISAHIQPERQRENQKEKVRERDRIERKRELARIRREKTSHLLVEIRDWIKQRSIHLMWVGIIGWRYSLVSMIGQFHLRLGLTNEPCSVGMHSFFSSKTLPLFLLFYAAQM